MIEARALVPAPFCYGAPNMSRDAVKTLFHPFATRVLTPPSADERVLFLGAEAGYDLPEDFNAPILSVQAFRPLYLGLERRGIEAQPFAEGEGFDWALILMGRHRGQNEAWLADALARVDRKSTRLNSSHRLTSRMPSSA
jgi:16S rRNA (guanine1207-N2)-methyltransferase